MSNDNRGKAQATATRVVRTVSPHASTQRSEPQSAAEVERLAETAGRSSPLRATVVKDGVNFSLFSRTATGVELVVLRPRG